MTAATLAVGVLAGTSSALPARHAGPPKPGKLAGKSAMTEPSTPGHPWQAKAVPAAAPMKGATSAAPVFPAAATVDVPLAGSATGTRADAAATAAVPALARAGASPVWVGAVTPGAAKTTAAAGAAGSASGSASSPASVTVTVVDHQTAVAAGVTGAIVEVGRSDGQTGAAQVRVAIDYSAFGQAYGGDFGGRLQLTALPQCAVTTPKVASCQKPSPVTFTNDTANRRLLATVTLPAATPASGTGVTTNGTTNGTTGGTTGGTSKQAKPGTVVLAATSTSTSSGGSYTATSLSASNQWSVSGNTGSFTYNYPVAVPPALGGSAPQVALAYDSGSVDGKTAVENSQPSWVGEGWDYSPGFIERSTVSCSKAKPTAYPTSNDNCFARGPSAPNPLLPAFTLSYGAHGGQLVHDDADTTNTVFKLPIDDGTRITLLTGAPNGAVDANGEWFRIQTPDGSSAYFGANHLPAEQNGGTWGSDPATSSTFVEPVFNNPANSACSDPTKVTGTVPTACYAAYRWNLDYVVDPHGNVIKYTYLREGNSYGRGTGYSATGYTRGGNPSEIDYGWQTADVAAGHNPAAKVTFATVDRCIATGTPYAVGADAGCNPTSTGWPSGMMDTPTDMVCTGATCGSAQVSPTFWTKYRLVGIDTQVAVNNAYQKVSHYDLFHSFPATDNVSWSGLWLAAIRRCAGSAVSGGTCPQAANGTANQQTLPDVQFTGVALAQRVPGVNSTVSLPSYLRYRISTIWDELGADISVAYDDPTKNTTTGQSNYAPLGCIAPPTTAPDWHNHQLCYPEYWTPQGLTAPITDWFHKYVAVSVDTADNTGTTGDVLTGYSYDTAQGAAWHSNDSELLTDNTYRTYDGYRGFASVTTTVGRTGDVNHPQTQSVSYYLRGMDQDPDQAAAKAGSCNLTDCPTVFVTDSQGGSTQDDVIYNGNLLETKQVKTADAAGAGGAVWTDTVTRPWKSDPQATHARTAPLPVQRSRELGTAETVVSVPLAGGGTRITKSDNYYDQGNGGRIAYADTLAPAPADGSPELCTTTGYASNAAEPWMLGYAATDTVTTGPCLATTGPVYVGAFPATAATGGTVVSGTRKFYDNTGTTFSTTTLSKGDVNRVEALSGAAGTAGTFTLRSTNVFDGLGRTTQAGDAAGRLTTTVYTPTNPSLTSLELPARTVVTNPLGWTTTATTDPRTGLPIDTTDANGRVTHTEYDGLGRLTGVWMPDHTKGAYPGTPNQKFSYTLNGHIAGSSSTVAPSVEETDSLREDSTYLTGFTLFDSLGRTRQEQSPTMSNDVGRIVTDTSYDSAGRVNIATGAYYDKNAAPSGALWTVDTQAPRQAQTYYDGYGRSTATLTLSGATELWRSTTSYPGADRTDLTPPAGGTRTSTVTDARGDTVALYTYHGADTGTYPWGTTDPAKVDITSYGYDAGGHRNLVKDAAGNQWTTTYDLLGRKTAATDPDAGSSTITAYDTSGNPTDTTDSRGTSLHYVYDALGRKTDEYQGTSTSGTLLAHWDFDSLAKGYLTDSVRYTAGASGPKYKIATTGYDPAYRILGSSVTIPAGDGNGALGGASGTTYTTTNHYTPITGRLDHVDLPVGGDLQPDTVYNGYNVNGLIVGSGDNFADLLTDSGYSPFGEVQRRMLGDYPSQVVADTVYDPATRRVSDTTVSQLAWNAPIDSTAYVYNPSGQITATVDKQGTASSISNGIVSTAVATDTQCFGYDYAGRLTSAWTDTGGATGTIFGSFQTTGAGSGTIAPYASPAPGGLGGCANATPAAGHIGGPAPYWETFGYDNATGNRLSETEQDNTGAVTAAHTYSYGTAGAQPHTLTKTVTTGSGAGTDNYTYDPAGNTKTRALNGKPTQNLSFDAEGRLTSDSDGAAASAAYVYDADGTQLIRRDATTTTLYLGTTELHLNNTTGTVAGDRYFSYSGGPTIVESGGSTPAISYEAGNPQNTASTTIAASPTTADKAVTARRATTPFNTPRGTGNTTSPWNAAFPDDHTFLGMTTDTTTALVDVGARKYDPTLGRFLSIDPVFQPDSPQDLGGYAYAADDPINHADPSGQCWVCLSSIVKVVNVVAQAAPVLNVIAEATAAVPGLNVVTAGMAAVGDVAMVASNVIGVVQGADAVYHDIKDGKSLLDTGMDVFDTVSSARGLKGAGSELRGAKDRVSRAARGDADAAAEGTAAGVDAVDDTPATDHGSSQGSDSDNCATRAHSFKGDTPVLMADGTRKLISQVRVGDEIADAVPDGRDEKHRVDAVHVTLTDTDFTDLTVNTPDGAKPITTTQNHPFFDVTQDKFVPAGELKPGDQLQTTGGGRLTVLAVRNYVSTMVTFDLTIDGLHTYYVEAGATPVLVHNCDLHDMARAESAKSESNNTAAAMARDRYTGVTEYGESGMTPKEVHPALKDRLDDLVKEHGSLEEWPAGECAEFNACNNLLLKHGSVNPDEVEYATIVRKTGEIYPSCENCRTILHGAGMHERAF